MELILLFLDIVSGYVEDQYSAGEDVLLLFFGLSERLPYDFMH